MNKQNILAGIGLALLMALGVAMGDTNLEITAFSDGYLTWTNINPDLYYSVQWRPTLSGTNGWNGSYSGCQDLRSANQTITVAVPVLPHISNNEPYVLACVVCHQRSRSGRVLQCVHTERG